MLKDKFGVRHASLTIKTLMEFVEKRVHFFGVLVHWRFTGES